MVGCLSELKTGTNLLARTEKFVPETFFKKPGVWTSDHFQNILLAHNKSVVLVSETSVSFCNLVEGANDVRIQTELPEGHIFNNPDIFLPFLAGLIDRQAKGESGDLLNNVYANIFYVRVGSEVFVVCAHWHPHVSEWYCYAHHIDGGRWLAKRRVFLATVVTQG